MDIIQLVATHGLALMVALLRCGIGICGDGSGGIKSTLPTPLGP